jgi:perosamine synthetase
MIPIYKPYLTKKSLEYAHEALDSTWISSQGRYIQMATEKLQELLNVKYVQLVNNGTSAMHLVAKCIAVKKGKTEVIVPDNVYVAAWNSFLFDGNFTLYSVPCDLNTWNYDLAELDKAIALHPDASVLIVHNIGNIINVPELQRKYPDTIFIEDACEAFGGYYEEKHSGTASYCGAFSTFSNKTISSGEGGFFITNNEETYLYVKCIQGQGQSNKRFIHSELGNNFRMTNICAAILYGQLEILPKILEKKQKVFDIYKSALNDREDVLLQQTAKNTVPSNWMFGIRIPGNENYDKVEKHFKDAGIEIRPNFYPITAH